MAEANEQGYELDWDGVIEKDGLEFVTLPAGTYQFVVNSYSRAHHTPKPTGKLPACKMITLDVEFDGGALGNVNINHSLFLHSSTEGFLSAFFTSIGLKQPGERTKMDWNAVPMARGRAKLKVERYTKDGEERSINKVDQFLAFDPSKMGAPVAAYAPPQPVAGYPQQPGYAAPQGVPPAVSGYSVPPVVAPPYQQQYAGNPNPAMAQPAPQAPQPYQQPPTDPYQLQQQAYMQQQAAQQQVAQAAEGMGTATQQQAVPGFVAGRF